MTMRGAKFVGSGRIHPGDRGAHVRRGAGICPATAVPAAPPLAPALVTISALPASPAVDAYYRLRGNAPIWFRDGVDHRGGQAAARRSSSGRRSTGSPRAPTSPAWSRPRSPAREFRPLWPPLPPPAPPHFAEDKLLSAAWVQYVRALKAPIAGHDLRRPALAPSSRRPSAILDEAEPGALARRARPGGGGGQPALRPVARRRLAPQRSRGALGARPAGDRQPRAGADACPRAAATSSSTPPPRSCRCTRTAG